MSEVERKQLASMCLSFSFFLFFFFGVQSSIRIAPASVSSSTIGFDPSPSATDILAKRFERSSPLVRPASSALRLRLFGSEVPLTCSLTVGVGARGFRGISGTFTKAIGFCSSVEDSGLCNR